MDWLRKEHICTLAPSKDGGHYWNSTDIHIPYDDTVKYLLFEVVVRDKERMTLKLDNFTLLNANCTFDAPIGNR